MAQRNLTAAEVLERILMLDSEDSEDNSQRDSEGEAEPQQPDPISSDKSEEEEEVQQNVAQAGHDGAQWEVEDRPNVGRVGCWKRVHRTRGTHEVFPKHPDGRH